MSGEKESLVQKKLDEFIKELDVKTQILLPINNPLNSEIEEALNLSYDQLRSIAREECYILSYKLLQYSVYIQKIKNRYSNIKRWADSNINIMIGKESGNYGNTYTKFEEKKLLVIANDEYAKALYQIWLKYGALENELDEVSNRINYISKSLQEIKNVRQA